MSSPVCKRRDVMAAIRQAFAEFTAPGATKPFFRTARRGVIILDAETPAAFINKAGWQTLKDGNGVRCTMRLVVTVTVSNDNLNADTASDLLEEAVGYAEQIMELSERIREAVTHVTPVGGADNLVEESAALLDSNLAYEIQYQRRLGRG